MWRLRSHKEPALRLKQNGQKGHNCKVCSLRSITLYHLLLGATNRDCTLMFKHLSYPVLSYLSWRLFPLPLSSIIIFFPSLLFNEDLEKGWVSFFILQKPYFKFVRVFSSVLTLFNMVSNLNNSNNICRLLRLWHKFYDTIFPCISKSRQPHTKASTLSWYDGFSQPQKQLHMFLDVYCRLFRTCTWFSLYVS